MLQASENEPIMSLADYSEEERKSDLEDNFEEEETESEPEDWYNDSDTSENIPDPDDSEESLFQDINKLPIPISPNHFVEGLLYCLTMKNKKSQTSLGMIIEKKENTFIFRTFFVRGSKRKTFHEGAKDKEYRHEDV